MEYNIDKAYDILSNYIKGENNETLKEALSMLKEAKDAYKRVFKVEKTYNRHVYKIFANYESLRQGFLNLVKVGMTLYVVSDYDASILNAKVLEVNDDTNISVQYENETYTVLFRPSDFGKYIFFNKEDAQNASNILLESGEIETNH